MEASLVLAASEPLRVLCSHWPLPFHRFWISLVALILVVHASFADPLPDLRLPTKNYLNNGGFERGEEGWEFFAGRRFGGVVKDEKHSGEACFKASGVLGDHCYFQQNLVPLTPGKTYTLSAWTKCSGLHREGQAINLANYGWTKAFDLMPKKADEEWTKYSVTFQAPPTQDNGVQPIYNLIVYWPPKTEGTLWVDDLQIEEGGQSTDLTDRYVGWAFDTLATLRRVTIQAEAAQASLNSDFKAFPIAQTLSAKAGAVLGKARTLAAQLDSFGTLSTPQAQSLKADAGELTKDVASLKSVYFLGNPYLPLTEVALPDKPQTDLHVEWTCLKGEQRAIAVNVANLTRQSSLSRIVPGELTDVARGARVVGTSWLAAYNVPPIRGHLKPTETFTDPMPRMDEAGVFLIGSNGLSQAVLVFDTSSLLPGEYRGSVEVASLGDAEDRHRIIVKLTVLPVRLPRITDKDICTVGAMADYAMDSIEPMGINTFTIPAQWLVPEYVPHASSVHADRMSAAQSVDFARIAPLVKTSLERCPDARFLLAFGVGAVVSNHLKQVYNLNSDSPPFKVLARSWVRSVVKGFAALGVPPERIIFETVDEPGEGQLAEAAMWAEIIKAAAKAQTQSYVTSFRAEDKQSARLYETHDILAPGFASINEQTVSHLRKRGKKVWVYDCQNNGETFHPIAYYRLLPWLVRRYGLDGWGHFSWLNSERGRGYEPWEGVAEESLVYPNLSG
ncbi:MAG: carbohydrate binding domain-containing protein, partial [Armatimonadetes bacterium]|nr:carbohydrate binding domain-containing protein [Armatimonadota bacterium]